MPVSLSAHDVSHRFGVTTALNGASVDVPAARAVALVGESGSGKTTMLRCFNGLVRPERGDVRVGDVRVNSQASRAMLGMVCTTPSTPSAASDARRRRSNARPSGIPISAAAPRAAIMSGVRTAAVITVGAATLAAFIGAGGLGEPIVQGLALVDTSLVLSGAIPAALLAVLVDGVLWTVERRLRPAHLRKSGDAAWPWWRGAPSR